MPGHGRRLVVVEDEALTASLLAEVLRTQRFEVETAANVSEARRLVNSFDPDAVLLDISLGEGPTGLDLAHVLHRQRPDIAILFLTKHPDHRTAGISLDEIPPNAGFLRKDMVRDTEYLVESLNAVLNDRPAEVRHDEDPAKPLAALSAKHLEVLRLVALGYTNDHIATLKRVNNSSVERWTAEIFRALDIDTRGVLNPRVEAARQFIAAAGIPQR